MSESKYSTKRISEWRKGKLKETFSETLDVVEEHGCQVWAIKSDWVSPSFAYTVGAFDTTGQYELITIGLAQDVAHGALNRAVSQMRAGTDLLVGRHKDLVGSVDVEFRPVRPAWLHHIMLRTDWYYRGEDVPVLQLVYPDLENRFPEDEEFDAAFDQPILSASPDDPESTASDLWAAYDERSSLSRWKFPGSPHTSAYLSAAVHDGREKVVFVSHDHDGDWQFLGDSMSNGGGPVVTCLHHPIDADRSLEELHDLPVGWYAERPTPEDSWRRSELPPDESEGDDRPLIQ